VTRELPSREELEKQEKKDLREFYKRLKQGKK